MDGMLALTIICVVFAFGDFVSEKSKAVISVLLVGTFAFLLMFWAGVVPTDIFKIAGISGMASMMFGMVLVHMGSLLNLTDLVHQWKTAVLGLIIVIGGGLLMFALTAALVGKNLAVAIVGSMTGGFVSAIVVSEMAIPLGLHEVSLLAATVVATHGIVGYPLGSFFLRLEAQRLAKRYRDGSITWTHVEAPDAINIERNKRKHWQLPSLPENLQTPFVLLAKCAIVSLLAFRLAAQTQGFINAYVMCLLLGIVFAEINFLEYDILRKGGGYGIGLLCVMSFVINILANVTPQMIAGMVFPVIVAFAVGLVSLFAAALIFGKPIGFSWQMSLAIATTCTYGFPGTYILSNEVANKIGKTNNEVKMLLDILLPTMLVSGFICLSITSVILTGFMVRLLN